MWVSNERYTEYGITFWVMKRVMEIGGETLHFRNRVGYANALAADGPEQRKYCADRLREGRAAMRNCIAEQQSHINHLRH